MQEEKQNLKLNYTIARFFVNTTAQRTSTLPKDIQLKLAVMDITLDEVDILDGLRKQSHSGVVENKKKKKAIQLENIFTVKAEDRRYNKSLINQFSTKIKKFEASEKKQEQESDKIKSNLKEQVREIKLMMFPENI